MAQADWEQDGTSSVSERDLDKALHDLDLDEIQLLLQSLSTDEHNMSIEKYQAASPEITDIISQLKADIHLLNTEGNYSVTKETLANAKWKILLSRIACDQDFDVAMKGLDVNELHRLLHFLEIERHVIAIEKYNVRALGVNDIRLEIRAVLVTWRERLGHKASKKALFEARRKVLNGRAQQLGGMEKMTAHQLLMPTIQESDLIYHEFIGSGGFGRVYRATWRSNDFGDLEAAAKKINVPQGERNNISNDLKNEINISKRLKHPSIIEFYGLTTTSEHLVLVTEYAALGSLFNFLETKPELSRDLKTKWAIQVVQGLEFLRLPGNSILHRDIKSPNLLITAGSDMKICDFGLSKVLEKTGKTSHLNKGSIQWQAPEIFIDGILSPKADIFAFGVVLWEMETCEKPYKGMAYSQIMFKVGNNGRLPVPDLCPPALKKLIEQCWHREKDSRPNYEELIRQLKQL